MNETPRTDKEVFRYTSGDPVMWMDSTTVSSDFARALERENAKLRELLQDVLNRSVDARAYPDGPCLERELRSEIKAALANVKDQPHVCLARAVRKHGS